MLHAIPQIAIRRDSSVSLGFKACAPRRLREKEEPIGRLSIELQKLENRQLEFNRRVTVPVLCELSGCLRSLQTRGSPAGCFTRRAIAKPESLYIGASSSFALRN